jgi:hypothetical protein
VLLPAVWAAADTHLHCPQQAQNAWSPWLEAVHAIFSSAFAEPLDDLAPAIRAVAEVVSCAINERPRLAETPKLLGLATSLVALLHAVAEQCERSRAVLVQELMQHSLLLLWLYPGVAPVHVPMRTALVQLAAAAFRSDEAALAANARLEVAAGWDISPADAPARFLEFLLCRYMDTVHTPLLFGHAPLKVRYCKC